MLFVLLCSELEVQHGRVLYWCYTGVILAKCGILEDKISFCGRDLDLAAAQNSSNPSRFHLEVVKCAKAHDCVPGAGAGAGDPMLVLNRWTTSHSSNTAPGHRTAGY